MTTSAKLLSLAIISSYPVARSAGFQPKAGLIGTLLDPGSGEIPLGAANGDHWLPPRAVVKDQVAEKRLRAGAPMVILVPGSNNEVPGCPNLTRQ